MHTRTILLTLALLLIALPCASQDDPLAVDPGEGFGPVRIGMSPEEVTAILGPPVKVLTRHQVTEEHDYPLEETLRDLAPFDVVHRWKAANLPVYEVLFLNNKATLVTIPASRLDGRALLLDGDPYTFAGRRSMVKTMGEELEERTYTHQKFICFIWAEEGVVGCDYAGGEPAGVVVFRP